MTPYDHHQIDNRHVKTTSVMVPPLSHHPLSGVSSASRLPASTLDLVEVGWNLITYSKLVPLLILLLEQSLSFQLFFFEAGF
jgi:hypothetical protein